jgi:hypothetical protein
LLCWKNLKLWVNSFGDRVDQQEFIDPVHAINMPVSLVSRLQLTQCVHQPAPTEEFDDDS